MSKQLRKANVPAMPCANAFWMKSFSTLPACSMIFVSLYSASVTLKAYSEVFDRNWAVVVVRNLDVVVSRWAVELSNAAAVVAVVVAGRSVLVCVIGLLQLNANVKLSCAIVVAELHALAENKSTGTVMSVAH